MASKAARYGVGIGTGAASGAATGASIGGPWGALIGGVIGGGAGAIGAAVQNSDEDKQRALFEQRQKRERQLAAIEVLRNQAQQYGADTSYLDALLQSKGLALQQGLETKQFALQHQLDPNAFVGMATAGARAAGGIYKAANQPQMSQPTQIQGIPSYPTLQNQGDYQLDERDLDRYRGLA